MEDAAALLYGRPATRRRGRPSRATVERMDRAGRRGRRCPRKPGLAGFPRRWRSRSAGALLDALPARPRRRSPRARACLPGVLAARAASALASSPASRQRRPTVGERREPVARRAPAPDEREPSASTTRPATGAAMRDSPPARPQHAVTIGEHSTTDPPLTGRGREPLRHCCSFRKATPPARPAAVRQYLRSSRRRGARAPREHRVPAGSRP